MPRWIVASPIAALKSDWRHFKEDPPGERFERQRERVHERSPALSIVLAVIGVVVVAGGVFLMFFPGPGLPVIVLGLGLVATVSRRLARWMDRAEPVLRRRWTAIKRWWKKRRRRTG